MAILEVICENNCQLQNIANTFAAAKKVVVVTGAGISTNCGVPDFRSGDGLYSLIQGHRDAARSKSANSGKESKAGIDTPTKDIEPCAVRSAVKGKTLFDSMIWKDPTSTSVFYKFIASLRRTILEDIKQATATHRFIRTLRDRRKLVRCYTQNIDGLEAREGLCTDLTRGKGSRARFTKKASDNPKTAARTLPGGDLDGGCEIVQLHGNLEVLRCTLCQQTCPWSDDYTTRLLAGTPPRCPYCIAADQDRQDRGKRGTKIGILRPDIVLYGEEHPSTDAIGSLATHDLSLAPDVLLILGTSLHVHGLKILVREFAKAVHARAGGRGKVIFVNLSRPAESVWKDVIDYWVCMDCDEWVEVMKKRRPDLWQGQEELKLCVRKPVSNPPAKVSPPTIKKEEEEKENRKVVPESPRWRPVVLASPKKKKPLQEHVPCLPPLRVTTEELHLPFTKPDQLPTPPSSGHGPRFQTPSKKRGRKSLAERYDEMCETPSKRTKCSVDIWEDGSPEL